MTAALGVEVVAKPWGRELIYARHRRYVGKIIVVERGHRLSLQFHERKHETIYCLRGRFRLRLGRRSILMRPGMAQAIAPGTIHRFEARYGRATILEVSTPELDDVVRLQDDYGRQR